MDIEGNQIKSFREKSKEDAGWMTGNYNVGPDDTDCWTTGELVSLFCKKWNEATGSSMKWINQYDGGPHEANFLKLDCSKLKKHLGGNPDGT